MRHIPPSVVTMLAGGMWSDFSPCSLMTMDGQQLSRQLVEVVVTEAPASVSQELAHPGAVACVLTVLFIGSAGDAST